MGGRRRCRRRFWRHWRRRIASARRAGGWGARGPALTISPGGRMGRASARRGAPSTLLRRPRDPGLRARLGRTRRPKPVDFRPSRRRPAPLILSTPSAAPSSSRRAGRVPAVNFRTRMAAVSYVSFVNFRARLPTAHTALTSWLPQPFPRRKAPESETKKSRIIRQLEVNLDQHDSMLHCGNSGPEPHVEMSIQ